MSTPDGGSRPRLLFLVQDAPYRSAHVIETFDSILAASAFELPITVLFRGAGVWQLLSGQDGAPLGLRTLTKILTALPHYDVERLYACATSLAENGLDRFDLAVPVTVVDPAAIRALLADQDVVLSG